VSKRILQAGSNLVGENRRADEQHNGRKVTF